MRLPLSVQMPAERPYGVLFAFAIASAGVRNVSTDSTGPKISSRAIRWLVDTLVKIVGANQNPFSGIAHGGGPALGALGLADVAQLADPLELLARC